jgi:hypothetical protein
MAAWPTTVDPVSAKFGSMARTRVSAAQSFKRNVRSHRRAALHARAQLPQPHRGADGGVLGGDPGAARPVQHVHVVVPHGTIGDKRGTWPTSSAIQVNGAGQTGRTINLKGFTISQTGVVKAGDPIKFADTKVYMATADANSNGSGKAAVSIEPGLIVSPADSEAVVYSAVPFTLALVADTAQLDARPGVLHDFDVSFIEAY